MSSIIFAKLDPGFFSNRKVIRAGRNGRDVFLAALCMNANRGAPGSIPAADLEPWYLAHYLGITEAEAQDGVDRAVTAGLIAIRDDEVVIAGWDQDWARRPKTIGERSKGYRDRHDASVTRHGENSPSRIDQRRGEEREARVTREGSLSGLGSGSGRSARDKRVSDEAPTQPASWEPSAEALNLATSLQLDITHEAANFRDHWAAKGQWPDRPEPLFAKWLRNSRDRGKRKAPKAGATTTKKRDHVVILNGKPYRDDGEGGFVPVRQDDGKKASD